ncbi:MAG: hypothetical protein WC205_10215 [Opitutaceae bacterium]|jgi:hypothetical protein
METPKELGRTHIHLENTANCSGNKMTWKSGVTQRRLRIKQPVMHDEALIMGLRMAGVLHFVTLVVAWFTPIPPDWEKNLAALPEVHRRFAVAQNVFIGAVILFCGAVSLFFAPVLADGSTGGRILCAGIALWWGGRLIVLPWLHVWPGLRGKAWRAGFVLLHAQCAIYAAAYGWLSMR